MNVFVLCTGRCGSMTFVKACRYITNYTASHESRLTKIGKERLSYPDNHIEVDNRLSWFLGRLDAKYKDNAFYVHLSRELFFTAKSFDIRRRGIIKYYREGIYLGGDESSTLDVAYDYCNTVTSNIEFFLRDKIKTLDFNLENAKEHFKTFWRMINAEGNLDAALKEWDIKYNAGGKRQLRI